MEANLNRGFYELPAKCFARETRHEPLSMAGPWLPLGPICAWLFESPERIHRCIVRGLMLLS